MDEDERDPHKFLEAAMQEEKKKKKKRIIIPVGIDGKAIFVSVKRRDKVFAIVAI